jgi:hypothetical protein
MLEGIENYPLTWPVGWLRTLNHKRQHSAFADRSIAKAAGFVLNELRLMGARSIIISSNLRVRQDGLPLSKQRRPDDPGVAVYFLLKNEPRVLACDKWLRSEDNLWAIGKHIEAIRGQERWGVGTIEQAFSGYAALPAPKSSWWEILGVSASASEEAAYNQYRVLAMKHHPDTGGNNEAFLRIQAAWEQACKERNWKR